LKNKQIVSPIARGSGAFIIHRLLAEQIHNYRIESYSPLRTLMPLSIKFLASVNTVDLIHTTPDYAIFSAKKSVPLVITFHNYVLDKWMRQYSSFAQKIHYMSDLKLWTYLAVKRASAITAVSHYTAGLIKKEFGIESPVRVIYNGIDTDCFKPSLSIKPKAKEISIFFSGNLTSRKGAQWLPAISDRLDTNIRIYYTKGLRRQGSLPASNRLQSIGSVTFHDMPQRYRDMDILLMPTVREGFGLSVAEAMACGLPVVATNCSAVPELIDEGKGGFLCPAGDVDAFAEKLNILANSPKMRREMGEYNRSKVEKEFTLMRMVKEYDRLFHEILEP